MTHKTRSMMLHLYAVSMGLYIGYPKLVWLILIDDHSSAMWSTPRDLQPTFNPCCFCAEVLIASTFSTWSSMPASRHLWSRIITLCGIFGAECSLMNWCVHIYLHIIRFMYTISVCAWIMHRCSIAATQSRHLAGILRASIRVILFLLVVPKFQPQRKKLSAGSSSQREKWLPSGND